MNTPEAYFGDIRSRIVERLDKTENTIKIAMAWFTNEVLFGLLVDKAAGGTKIELLISGSDTNFLSGYSLPFETLQKKGAKIYVLTSKDGYQFMHHKFVILDEKEVITGSYNWSNNAHTNFENIIVLNDASIVTTYTHQFDHLIKNESTLSLEKFRVANKSNNVQESIQADTALYRLSQEFSAEVSAAMEEARGLNLGLRLQIIEGMIRRYTAVGAARKLSNDDEQSGFLKLVSENHADLTFEYLTAKSHYARLFDKATIKNAKNKLRPYIGNQVDNI